MNDSASILRRGGRRAGAGRPPSELTRDRLIHLRVSESDHRSIREAAADRALSISAYIRMRIFVTQ